MSKKNIKIGIIEKMVIVLILLIVGGLFVPKLTKAVETVIWSEARTNAMRIREAAMLFCEEKGKNWNKWKYITLYDLGINGNDLNGSFFKSDSYSILFWGYNDFLIKIKRTQTTRKGLGSERYLVTLDENGTWGYVE